MLTKEEVASIIQDPYCRISDLRSIITALQLPDTILWGNEIELLKTKEQALKKIYKSKEVSFIKINAGSLAVGGRPSLDKIKQLKTQGTDCIITLLKEEEKGVQSLGGYITAQEISWIWFPLAASQLTTEEHFKQTLLDCYQQVLIKLGQGKQVFIHCAAGVHRTGAFTYGLLLMAGYSKQECRELIYAMRPVTAIEAIDKHWQWSEKMVSA